jgi:hypothetical protein
MSTPDKLAILSVERVDGTEVIVEFSDSTLAVYTTQELAALRPERQTTGSPEESAHGGPGGT